MVEHQVVDPWDWYGKFGIVAATEVRGSERTLWCSGLVSSDEHGAATPVGDIRGQLVGVLDQIEHLLDEAGMTLANVVRLNVYTTDIDGLLGAYDVLTARLAAADAKVTGSMLGVARLASPEHLLEIEITAVA